MKDFDLDTHIRRKLSRPSKRGWLKVSPSAETHTTPPSPERSDPSQVPTVEAFREALRYFAEILRQQVSPSLAARRKIAEALEILADSAH